jgi:ADP-ribose pyrophosphatase YjhB (NUDIX family)
VSPRLLCPHCGGLLDRWDQPRVTVDAVVVREPGRVLLVERAAPPPGWALPGGFVDAGETLEEAVVRELREETGLRAREVVQFHTYSDPARDPRHPTVSTIFLVDADGEPRAGDDAHEARFFPWDALPGPMAFDHERLVDDVRRFRSTGERPEGFVSRDPEGC